MNITLIGSSQYQQKFYQHQKQLEALGHTVKIPAFDSNPDLDELGVCDYNRRLIKWADEVHIIWDQRSMGTVFDFGMCFALRKPVIVVYLEPKTLGGVMLKYEHIFTRSPERSPDN